MRVLVFSVTIFSTIGAFIGTVVAIRRYLIGPILEGFAEFRALLELPELVRDLTGTTTKYVAENEARHAKTESRLARLERAVGALIKRVFGTTHPEDPLEPPAIPPSIPPKD